MKKILLLSLAVMIAVTTSANPVDPARAAQVAKNYVSRYVKGADQFTATVAYTHTMPESGLPAMYVINVGNTFVIVSANNIAHPVLGYSLERPWPTRSEKSADASVDIPLQIMGFLNDLASQIESAAGQQEEPDRETAAEWQQLISVNYQLSTVNLPDSVGPLLTTTWDQGQYYNALCPADPNGPDGHALTGCVATAMAQIINYWGYPVHGRGAHGYNTSDLDPNSMCDLINITGYGTLAVHFDSATYDYANMPSELTTISTPAQVNAVAQLMYHCGVAVNMFYDANASGAYVEDVRSALISYFGFNHTLGLADRQLYTDNEWTDSLKANINRGEPVFYSGSNIFNSHAFVLDGYTRENYFHFNFGWSGACDGWYLTTAITAGFGYNEWQSAIMGIRPDSNTTAVICQKQMNVQNRDVFIVSAPIDLYSLRGGSEYRATNEMTGVRINLNLVPMDSLDHLVLDVLEFDREQSVVIYDGINKDSLIRVIETRNLDDYSTITFRNWTYDALPSDTIFQNMADTIMSQITSTRNGFTIIVYSYGGMPEGFHLRVRKYSDTISQDSTTVNNRIYWTDVVTSEPDGYLMDGDTIRITSAEGLAWLAHRMDSLYLSGLGDWELYYARRTISIENDIDLNGYYWKPIRLWNGDIEGHGHVISNMIVNTSGLGGLFSFVNGKINNVGIRDSRINSIGSAGTLAGVTQNCQITNCWSMNHLINSGNGQGGGLIGTAWNSHIENSYAYGEIFAQFGYGGIIGYCSNSEIINCITQVGEGFDWGNRIIPSEWRGLFTEEVHGGNFSNCFSDISNFIDANLILPSDLSYLFLGNIYSVDAVSNLAAINISSDTMGFLLTDKAVNYTLGENVNVVTALNSWVEDNNVSEYRTWIRDSISHLPMFGDYYVATCPNVSNITAENIARNGGFAVALSWQENGNAETWQIKYNILNAPEDSAIVISVNTINDTLEGLHLGNDYVFYVRPICGGEDTVGWGQPYNFFVDKALWVDMVTSCPEGYQEDSSGNITISTPEGLAWLAKIGFDYRQTTIFIMNDLDMGAYKWTPIGRYSFEGGIEGNNHVIFNIYCNEDMADNNSTGTGLIAHANNAFFNNIIIQNSSFSGNRYVGSLVGYAENSSISNCHMNNVIVKGKSEVGGLGGLFILCETYNCSSSGYVYADLDEGGLVGTHSGTVSNCYSNCFVRALGLNTRMYYGGLIGTAVGIVRNSYSCGTVEIGLNDAYTYSYDDIPGGTLIGHLSNVMIGNAYARFIENMPLVTRFEENVVLMDISFMANGNLQTMITLGDSSYTDLLSVLNAWVDANNTSGVYRHWAADSANVNGGFPVFAAIPCTTVTNSDSIVVCDS